MIMITFVAVLVALFCVPGLSFVDFEIPPETVSEFDPSAYMGRWYQVYTSLVPRLTFEKNGVCVVADYLNPVVTDTSARFDILNSENIGSPSGKLKQVCGRAVNEHSVDSPGEFRVTFEKMDSMFAGYYWIVRLGEMEDGQTQYPWAIVSVPFQTSLFILARDVVVFKQKYETDVLALVRELGFKYFFNKPLETVQSAECKYPPKPKTEPLKPEPPKPEPPQLAVEVEAGAETDGEAGDEEAEAVEELADFEETERRLRFLQRDPNKTKRPSSDKTKKPKPPSMRRTKAPNKSRQPKEPKTQPPAASRTPTPAKPEPPPTPAKPSPPPAEIKPEPAPTTKPKPPPPPQKLQPPPPPPLGV